MRNHVFINLIIIYIYYEARNACARSLAQSTTHKSGQTSITDDLTHRFLRHTTTPIRSTLANQQPLKPNGLSTKDKLSLVEQ
jgi:hypothetical protein